MHSMFLLVSAGHGEATGSSAAWGRKCGDFAEPAAVRREICRTFGPAPADPETGFCFVPGIEPFIWQDALRDGTVEHELQQYPALEFGLQGMAWDAARSDASFLWSCYEDLGDSAACEPEIMRWLRSRRVRVERKHPVPHGWLDPALVDDVIRAGPFIVTLVPSPLLDLCSLCAPRAVKQCPCYLRPAELVLGRCDPSFASPDAGLESLAQRALETEILCTWVERGFDGYWEGREDD